MNNNEARFEFLGIILGPIIDDINKDILKKITYYLKWYAFMQHTYIKPN